MSNELVKLNDIMALGEVLAESKFFSEAKKGSEAVVKVLAGRELGIGPIAAMTGVNIIKGKVSVSGNIMASLVKASEKYDYRIVNHDDTVCLIEFFELGTSVGTSEFTIDDAKKAGLTSGENYKKYPKNMLFNRAISNGTKWFCPDLTNGQAVYTPDELEAQEPIPEPDYIIDASVSEPEPQLTNDTLKNTIDNVSIPALVRSLSGTPVEKLEWMQEYIESGKLKYEGAPLTVADMVRMSK